MSRNLGIAALALVMAAGGRNVLACDHEAGGGKSGDCAAQHAASAGTLESGAAGHECPLKAEECTRQMKRDAESHGWLGVSLDIDSDGPMSVTRIWPGSPAEKAGFQLGDRVVTMNGVEVGEKNAEKIFSLMRAAKIGDSMTFTVARDSGSVTLSARLAKMPVEVLSESIQKHLQQFHSLAKN